MSPGDVVVSDRDLVAAALAGRQHGFAGLVTRNLPGLVGFLRHLEAPPSAIDDLVQETFTRAFRSLATYDVERPFITWLLSIARNTLYDERREHARQRDLAQAAAGAAMRAPTPGVEEQVVGRQTLQEALASLDEPARFIIEMRLIHDLPFGDIAATTGETEGNLRVRFHRALGRLRATMGKEIRA